MATGSSSPVPARGNSKVSLGLLGDESVEFWREPLQYVERRKEDYGEVFLGRLLNKPTIFLTGSSSVKELLNDKWRCFTIGYKEFMFEIFGDNLIFHDGETWEQAREGLESVFELQNLSQSLDTVKQLIKDHIKETPLNSPTSAYTHFKSLATQISMKLFLSPLLTEDEMREITELMTIHWHGIISLPVNIKLPWVQWKSGYGKALAAKEKLLDLIRTKLQTQPSEIAAGVQSSCDTFEHSLNNILLFVTALIPKALASVMTSLLLELSKPENKRYCDCISDETFLEDVILECQRLWPPFFGGRRICTEKCVIYGHIIPEGHAVAYMSYSANRDNKVFNDPNQFQPERWRNENKHDRDLVWTFGGGPRRCIGQELVKTILKEWLSQFLSSLNWSVTSEIKKYKLLPVCRPTDDVMVTFSSLTPPTSINNTNKT
ncbi:PREDICTED: cytochrome P450 26B1-like [Amphimedon queenslandica]|uniref:Cytochrome P450 n=1 Tax=Amphimedon queenslandica TaxID=400682 RepID=A0A1X7TVF4_AMPQE|nr:PREDICTED: cytochrome P450 26B1-like [Amphimedon queenslandica]|eukprot:XP_019857503.1 PREDICTED: cytochrome P450 26B1-like [Amphimedon queenslandica]